MCNNGSFGNGGCWWIIILILLFFCCGNNGNTLSCGNSCGCESNGCGCC